MVFDLKIKGRYTTSVIGTSFLVSAILLFVIAKKTVRRWLSGMIAVPIAVSCVGGILSKPPLMIPLMIFCLSVQVPLGKYEIDDSHSLEVIAGGFLGCGDELQVTESQFGIFDRVIGRAVGPCIDGGAISSIDVVSTNPKKYEFLIYSDGILIDESPFLLTLEREEEN